MTGAPGRRAARAQLCGTRELVFLNVSDSKDMLGIARLQRPATR